VLGTVREDFCIYVVGKSGRITVLEVVQTGQHHEDCGISYTNLMNKGDL
jgi:hypothetical protein